MCSWSGGINGGATYLQLGPEALLGPLEDQPQSEGGGRDLNRHWSWQHLEPHLKLAGISASCRRTKKSSFLRPKCSSSSRTPQVCLFFYSASVRKRAWNGGASNMYDGGTSTQGTSQSSYPSCERFSSPACLLVGSTSMAGELKLNKLHNVHAVCSNCSQSSVSYCFYSLTFRHWATVVT